MLHYGDMSIEIPAWTGIPQYVAELWRMHKGDDVAVCAVWTHPDGAQLRLTVNGAIKQTDATHHVFALSTVALAWQERWHWMKGWR
jgi:hypothetical protein